ncbi:MAG: thiamine phosphate synthase [Marinilabiliales bacterium]
MKKVEKFHFITQDLEHLSHSQQVENVCSCGVKWVQMRIKEKPYEIWLNQAKEAMNICKKYNAIFIMNDNVAIARDVKADGVHLGKNDMNPKDARKILGENVIIGATANTFEDVKKNADCGADYIGLGPFRFTKTKLNLSPLLGLEGYKTILEQCYKHNIKLPIIAIGGIRPGDVKDIINVGVYGIAVSSAIVNADNITEMTCNFLKELK